jgi:hypothetical protein
MPYRPLPRHAEFSVPLDTLHTLTHIARARGLGALTSPSAHRVCADSVRRSRDPSARLRALAGRSHDPATRLSDLNRRSAHWQPARTHRASTLTAARAPERRGDDIDLCGACGWSAGPDPHDESRCAACGAHRPPGSATRSASRRDPLRAKLELRRRRIEAGW